MPMPLDARLRRLVQPRRGKTSGLLGDDFLQHLGFLAQILDLAAWSALLLYHGQPPLAGFQELVRPVVIQALGNALATTQRRDTALTVQHDPLILSHRWC
jgi:hypothetical protein